MVLQRGGIAKRPSRCKSRQEMSCTDNYSMCIKIIFQAGGSTRAASLFEHSKLGTISTAMVRKDSWLLDIMKRILSYNGAFLLEFWSSLVHEGVLSIVKETMATSCQEALTYAAFICLIRWVDESMWKEMDHLLERLSKNQWIWIDLTLSHWD